METKNQASKKLSGYMLVVILLLIAFTAATALSIFTKSRPQNTELAEISKADPKETVESFYNWYLQYEGNPLSSGAYKTSDYLTDNFKNNIDQLLSSFDKGGYDPIVLAQDLPSGITVGNVLLDNGSATVTVSLNFNGTQKNLDIKLLKVGDIWQIDNVAQGLSANQPPEEDTSSVIVYFNNSRRAGGNNDCEVVYGVERTVSSSDQNIYHTALEQLFRGPTNAEKAQGYSSFFSSKTGHILKSVKIVNSAAYVNLADIRSIIPNASSSCGSAQLLSQIEETLKHDRKVSKVIIAINGDPQTFYDWIQIGCSPENNNCDQTHFSE